MKDLSQTPLAALNSPGEQLPEAFKYDRDPAARAIKPALTANFVTSERFIKTAFQESKKSDSNQVLRSAASIIAAGCKIKPLFLRFLRSYFQRCFGFLKRTRCVLSAVSRKCASRC